MTKQENDLFFRSSREIVKINNDNVAKESEFGAYLYLTIDWPKFLFSLSIAHIYAWSIKPGGP